MTQSELTEPTGAASEFGELLRQHRLAAGLTQDSLAELAGLSVHGIQKLESGATHPYRDTAERALGEDDFAVAWAEGQSITIEQATADILSEESTHVQR